MNMSIQISEIFQFFWVHFLVFKNLKYTHLLPICDIVLICFLYLFCFSQMCIYFLLFLQYICLFFIDMNMLLRKLEVFEYCFCTHLVRYCNQDVLTFYIFFTILNYSSELFLHLFYLLMEISIMGYLQGSIDFRVGHNGAYP